MLIVSVAMMFLALIVQGAEFWFRDAFTRDLPTMYLVGDWIWVITLISLVGYRRYPWLTLTLSWCLLFTVAVLLRPFYFDRSFEYLIFISSPAFVNLAFGHLGVYARKRRKPDSPVSAVNQT
jgi:hypothetical protein